MSERASKPYQEYFLVASGNQALAKVGNLKEAGQSLNIDSGQLGVICAEVDSAVASYNDFLTGAEDAAEVSTIQIVQGTPNSADNADSYGWASQDNGIVRSCKIRASEVLSVYARHYQIPTYSGVLLSAMAAPQDDTNYSIYVSMNSARVSRSHRGDRIASRVFNTGTIPTVDDEKGWMLSNLLHRLNMSSRKIKGNDPFVALGLNLGGSATGTALGTVGLGDVIPFMVYDGVTYNIVADAALIQTIYRWITDTSAITANTTIEVLDLSIAGNKVAATGVVTVTNFANLASDILTVDGVALVEGVDFAAGASNNAAALAIQNAINGSAAAVTAVADGAVVTLTADTAGVAGNAITLAYASGGTVGLTISGATLTGGDDTNIDGVMIMGLAHQLPQVYNGLPSSMVDVARTEFGHGFAADATLTYQKASGVREPLQSGEYLLKRYDERAFAQTGLTSLAGHSDTLLQAPKYIVGTTSYTMISIDGVTNDKGTEHNYRVSILVPGTDDSGSATGATGVTVTTNAANTEADLNTILSFWLDSVTGIKYLGQAVAGTVCPA